MERSTVVVEEIAEITKAANSKEEAMLQVIKYLSGNYYLIDVFSVKREHGARFHVMDEFHEDTMPTLSELLEEEE